jgi:RNA polymerase sigma-70 factor (ECF subfamily)
VPFDQLLDREANEDTESAALDRIASDAALALVASLPRREAEAVLLRIVIGLNATEAARVMGTEPGAVRSAAHRGLRKLAGRIGPHGI